MSGHTRHRKAIGNTVKRGVFKRVDRSALRVGIAAGLIYAIAMVLAFPAISLWGFAIIMPLAIAWAAWRSRANPISLAIGLLIGTLPGWAIEHAWVMRVSEFGYPFFALYSATMTGLWGWMFARLLARWPGLPLGLIALVVSCVIEVGRGEVLLGGYPWYLAAHPVIDVPFLASGASVVGVYGLSALLAAVAGGIVDVTARRRWIVGLATVLTALVGWGVCSSIPPPKAVGAFRIGVIQTNNPQDNQLPATPWELIQQMQVLVHHTRAAAASAPALIVWPESMMPGRTLDPASIEVERRNRVYWKVKPPNREPFEMDVHEFALGTMALQAELGIPMLVGSESFDNLRIRLPEGGGVEYIGDHTYNSVFLLAGGAVVARYDKMFLTPFGEVMPGIRHWPWLQERVRALGAHGMPFDLTPGSERTVLAVPRAGAMSPIRAITPICFEATMPNVCRRLVYEAGRRRADVIVNGTNDGWFNASRAGRLQHLQGARWRCVELATPMARAANTGVSALVDHRGRFLQHSDGPGPAVLGPEVDGVLLGDLPIIAGDSMYARGGWAVSWIVAGFGAGAVGMAFLPRRLAPGTPSQKGR